MVLMDFEAELGALHWAAGPYFVAQQIEMKVEFEAFAVVVYMAVLAVVAFVPWAALAALGREAELTPELALGLVLLALLSCLPSC